MGACNFFASRNRAAATSKIGPSRIAKSNNKVIMVVMTVLGATVVVVVMMVVTIVVGW